MYNFLFDKKSLVLLLMGAVVAGGVLFFSGLLVGVQFGLPFEGAPAAAARPAVPRRAALVPADRPCLPEPQAAPVAPQKSAPEAVPIPEPELRASAAPPVEPEAFLSEPAPAPAPAPTVAQAMTRTSEPRATTVPAGGPGRFSLQIGAFRDPVNSEKVIQDLVSRGYEPYVIEQRGRSVLRTVRVGRYSGRSEALRAASEFRRREGMEAVVRPIGS